MAHVGFFWKMFQCVYMMHMCPQWERDLRSSEGSGNGIERDDLVTLLGPRSRYRVERAF